MKSDVKAAEERRCPGRNGTIAGTEEQVAPNLVESLSPGTDSGKPKTTSAGEIPVSRQGCDRRPSKTQGSAGNQSEEESAQRREFFKERWNRSTIPLD